MTITVGKYTFGAWMRKGLGRAIDEKDTLGESNGTVIERASVGVEVGVNGQGVKKEFSLLGPGDLIGFIPQNVVRTEPRRGVMDFEPNYLPFVEFYDEDFIWRYTPAKAAGNRLRPWLALAVLEEESPNGPTEFSFEERKLPLPVLTVKSATSLPSPSQLWAWGHVHVNEGFEDATDFERFLESLETEDHPNADRIICRLTSPRRLKPNTPYSAFVVPTFETGRRAALQGGDPSGVPAQQPAWSSADKDVVLPVFYWWRFRTGENEDFESLVKLLEPRPVDRRVGIRDMDGEKPGWGLTAGTDIGQIDAPPATPPDPPLPLPKQSVIGLEGALKHPKMKSRPENVDVTKPFFGQLQGVLNFPEERRTNPATENLPVVSPPIYGEHHAIRHTVDTSRGDWLDFLNRDPRQRVPAGFGTRVIQGGQEGYVARAWQQVQKVLEANKKIRLINWAMRVSQAIYVNFAQQLEPAQKIVFFGPLLSKVRGSPTTLAHQMSESTLPPAAVSGAMRRLLRPRGPVGRRLGGADEDFSQAGLVEGMAGGELTAAPPKPVPGDLATDTEVAEQLPDAEPPAWLRPLLALGKLLPTLLALLFVLLLILAILTGAWLVFGLIALVVAVAAAAIFLFLRRSQEAAAVTDPAAAAAATAAAPPRPGFHLVEADPVVPPQGQPGSDVNSSPQATSGSPDAAHFTDFSSFTPAAGGRDSVEGHDFRHAAVALGERLALTVPEPELHPFDLGNAGAKLSKAVDPLVIFPLQLSTQVRFPFDPERLLEPEHLVPAMAYPDFDDAMYQGLRDISSDLLLPNIELIPQNTITLLLTNPPFIESYMVGLNTEFGKELLWREYPTDRRGSYFRQFWDVQGIIAPKSGEDPAELSERSKDITPIDTWLSNSDLGTHRNPKRGKGEQLVLTVRGELLKKYRPLIYAQKAHLYHDPEGHSHPSHEPVLAEVATEADIEKEIKFPVFKAQVDPDLRFFGFDMSLAEARGADDPQQEGDDWGYYFVIQQLPGEPRFGMDVSFEPDEDATTPITWDDLAWSLFSPAQEFIDVGVRPEAFAPGGSGEEIGQWGEDASRMASILFQKPVMIAVHAKEMLEGLEL